LKTIIWIVLRESRSTSTAAESSGSKRTTKEEFRMGNKKLITKAGPKWWGSRSTLSKAVNFKSFFILTEKESKIIVQIDFKIDRTESMFEAKKLARK
jgi:hypothetical protein